MKISFICSAYETLGIQYLIAILKKYNHHVDLILAPRLFENTTPFVENIFSDKSMIIRRLTNFSPGLICFSVTSYDYPWAAAIAKTIKQQTTNTPILFGGIHPTSVPEDVIKNPDIDMVCIGEGEQALLEVVNSLEKNKAAIATIANIWSKKRSGEIIQNDVRPLIDKLDMLPFPDKESYYKEFPIVKSIRYTTIATRGCPYNCSYCNNNVLRKVYANKGPFLRRRSVSNVIEELEINKHKYNYKFVRFEDGTFITNQEWLTHFSKEYKKTINIPFFCWTHPETITETNIALLKNSNCYAIQLGIDSIDDTIRSDIFNKKNSLEQIKKAIQLIRNQNILCIVDNILGLQPLKQDLHQIMNFYSTHRPDFIFFCWIRNYPALKINDIMRQRNLPFNPGIKTSQFQPHDGKLTHQYIKKQGYKTIALYNLCYLLCVLPPRLFNFLLKSKIYYLLSIFPPITIKGISYRRSIKKTVYTLDLHRYLFFIFKKIFPK